MRFSYCHCNAYDRGSAPLSDKFHPVHQYFPHRGRVPCIVPLLLGPVELLRKVTSFEGHRAPFQVDDSFHVDGLINLEQSRVRIAIIDKLYDFEVGLGHYTINIHHHPLQLAHW